MNSTHVTLRAVTVAAAAAVALGSPALAAPKKTKAEPAPAAAPQNTGNRNTAAKTAKNKAKVTKTAPVPAAEMAPPQNTKTVKAAKAGKKTQTAPAPAVAAAEPAPAKKGKTGAARPVAAAVPVPPAEDAVEPKKPGLFKRMFGRRAKDGQLVEKPAPGSQAEAHLANAKPVVPRALPAGEEPEKKRGFFSFLRRNKSPEPVGWDEFENAAVAEDAKMERPADWQERSVVDTDGLALYEFGPSQAQGPDTSLGRGTVVTVKRNYKGWALVEVDGGPAGYVDASLLRQAAKTDFREPVPAVQPDAVASVSPEAWAPLAPPPDLPEQPGIPDTSADALLLLPPLLELEEPKKTPQP